jgi:AAA+ superfamily predicted ATPase
VKKRKSKKSGAQAYVATLLERHFKGYSAAGLVTSSRVFPVTAQVDLQKALERFVQAGPDHRLVGLHQQWGHDTLSFAKLWVKENYPVLVGPLQYEEIDVGQEQPMRCLKEVLWLGASKAEPFAVVMTREREYGRAEGVSLEVAVPPGENGLEFTRKLMKRAEQTVAEGRTYRGRVLSLEQARSHSGKAAAIRVHRLREVTRDEIILPERTLALLERNITEFIRHRDELARYQLGLKKGLLFYGPPGTGKTHTIHYLASQLPEHTTFLITAEQMGLLGEYMALARLLQPSIVVIEDVDLIARDRADMRSACEESLLNKLLNEMDGLREDAAVFFVLTTNRPEQLESALAGRPGRIDQAIEFPLPDETGRRKLAELYARALTLDSAVGEFIVSRTKGVSAAFIKELMRRSAQCMLEAGAKKLTQDHVHIALEELLFVGGSLNARLLGATAEPDQRN